MEESFEFIWWAEMSAVAAIVSTISGVNFHEGMFRCIKSFINLITTKTDST
jgi:hypothetical protein